MSVIADISNSHEIEHFNEQDATVAAVQRYYLAVVSGILPVIAAGSPRKMVERRLNALLEEMVRKTVAKVTAGAEKSWEISQRKTEAQVRGKYEAMPLPPEIEKAIKSRRTAARNAFIARKQNGLTLSDRVWKTADQYRGLILDEVSKGQSEGKSAQVIGRRIREALRNPQGETKPGQGVYKSPVKNAERLTRTTTNQSYRASDGAAYANNPLVLGYEIRLSATSKPKVRCEVCRKLEGKYPVTFIWTGWHPFCLCFKIPILMSRKMLDRYNKLIAQGKDTPEAVEKLLGKVRVKDTPDSLKEWLTANSERVAGWKNEPYWMQDNANIVQVLVAKG